MAIVSYRIFYGVDFTDEGFYISLAYRFAQGDIPFVAEVSPQQLSGILLALPIRIFLWANAGTEGIVLFCRFLYLLLACGSVAGLMLSLKGKVGRVAAVSAASLFLFYSFHFIPNISYNTLGSICLMLSLFFAFNLQGKSCSRNGFFMLGVGMGIMVVAYPTLVLVIPVVAGLILMSEARRGAFYLIVGSAVVGVPLLLFMSIIGFEHVLHSINFIGQVAPKGGGFGKVKQIFSYLQDSVPVYIWLCGLALISMRNLDFKWKEHVSRMFFFLIFIWVGEKSVIIFLDKNRDLYWNLLAGISLLSIIFRFSYPTTISISLFRWVCFPSLLAGLVTAWTSDTMASAFLVGAFPCVLAVSMMIIEVSSPSLVSKTFVLLTALVLGLGSALMPFQFMYRDEKFSKLDTLIERGPYAGIRTTEFKRSVSESLMNLKDSVPDDLPLIVTDDLPSGYLFFPNRCGHCSIWSYTSPSGIVTAYRNEYVKCIKQMNGLDYVSVISQFNARREDYRKAEPKHDPLRQYLVSNSHKVAGDKYFSLYISRRAVTKER